MPVRSHRIWKLALLVSGVLGYALLAFQTAWLSDDAVISLRTAANFLDGYGLRWNIAERVQTFTHPLWLFALTAAHAVTGEPFYSSLYLSLVVSIVAVTCLVALCPGEVHEKLAGVTVLVSSHAFVDFSSSGLENPLTHLLVISFVVVWLRAAPSRKRALQLSMIAGLAALNRLDTSLLFAPALLWELWCARRARYRHLYLVGALPLLVWEAFSIIYYGFPFPNTAYAKLNQAVGSRWTVWLDGLNYIKGSWFTDPVTLSVIGVTGALIAWRRERERAWLLCGALTYVLYVARIGGDFMTGRFLSAPLTMCVACLCSGQLLRTRFTSSAFAACTIAVAFMGPLPPPPLTGSDFRLEPGASDIDAFGAHNERRIFYPISSLKHAAEMSPLRADHPWSMVGFGMRREQERGAGLRVRVFDAIGYAGYFAGPHVHIVDHWALADALIARLPAAFGRYGHFPRVIPDGYVETLLTGRTLLTDPQLAAYYDELAIVVRAPVWSWRRMLAIWRLNTGALETTLDRYAFVRAQRVAVKVQVSNPTGYACVQTYVWNGDRTSAFLLDTASRPGASYDLVWQLTADRANLLQPAGAKQLTTFDGLRDHGFFTVSLAFTDQCGGPIRELHELRYTYKREGARLIVQRQPWPVWIERFPEGPWFEGLAKGVFGVVTVVHD